MFGYLVEIYLLHTGAIRLLYPQRKLCVGLCVLDIYELISIKFGKMTEEFTGDILDTRRHGQEF